jgi:hypothetical protein
MLDGATFGGATVKPIEVKAKDLCKYYSLLVQAEGTGVRVEYARGGDVHVLAGLRPDVTERGHASVKRILVIEDEHEKYYAGNYEFAVTAFIIGDRRLPPKGVVAAILSATARRRE